MADDTLIEASGVHIYSAESRSGIARYADDFHRLVLAPEGYVLADADTVINASGAFGPKTRFHVQLGVFQNAERRAVSALLRKGYRGIDATLHDPPFLTFPYFQFRSRSLMRISRGFDWYLGSLGIQRRALERLNRIFVLSHKGRSEILRVAPEANVITIPHIVREDLIWPAGSDLGSDMIFFGFIGPDKGLEYALNLHRAVSRINPGVHFHVAGEANGETGKLYLDRIRRQYQKNVTFHGFVPDDELPNLFSRAAHVILPYSAYKYVSPASGSLLHALRRGRIVWTTDANAMSEVVQDGQNGFILTMDAERDARRLASVAADETMMREISERARQTAIAMANYPYRTHFTLAPR